MNVFFQKYKRVFFAIFIFVDVCVLSFVAINIYIFNVSGSLIYKGVEDVPVKQVALILGARVYNNGKMSDILADRANTALDLYKSHKVQKILMSGDHGKKNYDEVNTVKDYLLENGVAPEDLFLDHAGFDTFDSVYRARDIFQVSSVIIVTQEFHLPRAVYLARSVGLDAVGIVADRHEYRLQAYNDVREFFARVKAFVDVSIQAKPKFLGDKIPVTGDSRLSWD